LELEEAAEEEEEEREKAADSAVAADLEAAGSARPNPSESFYMSQDLHAQTRLCTCTWR
jgi:hypothetical protein